MSKAKQQPILITGFKCRLDTIREEAIAMITNAVAEHKIIGTFYKNLGEYYRHDNDAEEYDSSPIVVTHNSSFGAYGGYEAATVYELFINEKGRLLCTLNGEAGEAFDEPIEHIQTEGLLCIVEWLVEYGFIADDPWRCEECGSLAVQDQVWIDSNTGETMLAPQNRSEYYCGACQGNIYHIRESELMKIIQQWWDAAEVHIKEAVTGIAVAAFAPEDVRDGFDYACNKFWSRLTNEEKIEKWRDNK